MVTFDPSEVTGGDIWFDQWLVIKGEGLRKILDMALRSVTHQEERYHPRRRTRRADDQRNLEEMVETIVANLARAVLIHPASPSIAVSLTKTRTLSRYDRRIFRQLRSVLGMLSNEGFLSLVIPEKGDRGWTSTFSPRPWFLSKMREHDVTMSDLRSHPGTEAVWLAKNEWGFGEVSGVFAKRRKLIDYTTDTRDSIRFRQEMWIINRSLADATIGMSPQFMGPTPDFTQNQLRRSFSLPLGASAECPAFYLGGRLFGGWWLNLPRTSRPYIRIDGNPIADLDFASMFPRLGCILMGLDPPDGDIYDIDGLRNHRAAVKAVVSALLFAEGERTRLPSEIKHQLPAGMSISQVRSLIIAERPFMKAILEKGLGLKLMFMESQIMVAALLDLISQEVTALSMHDGLMVSRANSERAKKAMQRASKAITGHTLPVELKESPIDTE